MPSERRVLFVRPSDRVMVELDRIAAKHSLSLSGAVAHFLERHIDDLAADMAKPVQGRVLKRAVPERLKSVKLQS